MLAMTKRGLSFGFLSPVRDRLGLHRMSARSRLRLYQPADGGSTFSCKANVHPAREQAKFIP